MIEMKQRKSTPIELISDFCVFIFLLTLFTFNHTIISNLGIVFLIVGTLLLCIGKNKFNFSYYFFFYAIFILYNYINTKLGHSINALQSLTMVKTLFLNFFIALILFNYITQRKNLKTFWYIFLAASGFCICSIIIMSKFNIFSVRFGFLANLTIFGILVDYNSNAIGDIIVCSIAACIYMYKTKGKSKYIGFGLIYLFLLLLTGSRRGIIQGLIATVFLLYLFYPKKKIKNTLIILTIGIIVYYLLMFVPVFYEIAGSRVESFFHFTQDICLVDASIASRSDYIKLGWKIFLEKPWTGYGLDCFRFFPGAYGTYSHNNYIELLVSGGLPALILYYLPIILTFFKLWKYRQQLNGVAIAVALLIAQQMVEYFGITYFERMPLIVIVYSVAVIKIVKESKNVNKTIKDKKI